MTEYWKSNKQYWCKYCSLFIRDDAPSRALHENGLRHQGNRERFLRDIYRTGEKSVKEKADEKKLMAQIEKQAISSHHAAGGGSTGSSSSPGGSSSSITAKAKPTDKWANYSTPASLGFIDKAEIEANKLQELHQERTKQGLASEWQTVQIITPQAEPNDGDDGDAPNLQPEVSSSALAGSLDHDPQEEARSFSLDAPTTSRARRRFDVGKYDDFEDGFDPDEILKRAQSRSSAANMVEGDLKASAKLKKESKGGLDRSAWQGLVIGKEGTPPVKDEATVAAGDPGTEAKPLVKAEPEESKVTSSAEVARSEDAAQPTDTASESQAGASASGGSSLFKKRRAPTAGNRSVRQKT